MASNLYTRTQTPTTNGTVGVKNAQLTNEELDNNFFAIDVTPGTVAASKAIVVDGDKDFTGLRNGTATGTLTAATVNATSDLQINGTSVLSVIPKWVLLETFTTTSLTAHANTSIPSGATQLRIVFVNCGTNGTGSTSAPAIQLGDSGGYTTTSNWKGYTTYSTSSISGVADTGGFLRTTAVFSTAEQINGIIDLTKCSSNVWVGSGVTTSTAGTDQVTQLAGSTTLSGTLDRIQITTSSGTATFDSGEVLVYYYSVE